MAINRPISTEGGDRESFAEAYAVVDSLVERHLGVLLAKMRQNLVADEYGNVVRDRWEAQLESFMDRVVVPELKARAPNSPGEVYLDEGRTRRRIAIPGYWKHPDSFSTIHPDLTRYTERVEAILRVKCDQDPDPEIKPSAETFEAYCAKKLEMAGWRVRICGGTGDQGVDLVAVRGEVVAAIQCKWRAKPVGNQAVQEVNTGRLFHKASIAVVVSNAEFTVGARAAAAQARVILLHESQLSSFDGRVAPAKP